MSSDNKKIIDDITTQIKTLAISGDLPGIADSSVVSQQVATNLLSDIHSYPAISVSPFGEESIDSKESSTKSNHTTYPILIAIIDDAGENPDLQKLQKRLLWREKLLDFFSENKSFFSSRVIRSGVRPLSIIDSGAWFSHDSFVSLFSLDVTVKSLGSY